MKKVLFLVPSLSVGGMERVLVNYANLFSRRGYDVTVLNFTFDDEAIVSGFDEGIHYTKNYTPVKNIFHISFREFLRGEFRLLPWKHWIKFHSARFLYKKYVKEQYDVEIAFFGMDAMKIIGGSTNAKAKKLGWLHNVNVDADIARYGEKSTRKIYNDIETIVCVSQKSADKLAELVNRSKNVFVVNNPNDSRRIRSMSQEPIELTKEGFTLTTVARIDDQQKGFFRLLDVCRRLNDEQIPYSLWIVGDGNDYDRVAARIRELQLSNVLLLGKKNNPYPYISNADLYLCASYYEGFSMVMMEAVILGTPMLSTAVSGADEMLDSGKYGMIVENSEEGLYEGMKTILKDPALWEHYKEMAQIRKDYLSEEKIMDRVEAIIEGRPLDE